MTTLAEIKNAFPGMDEVTARFTFCVANDAFSEPDFRAYREVCRADKDFKTADWIRDQMLEHGARVRDKSLN